jgi:flagellar protein FlaJ
MKNNESLEKIKKLFNNFRTRCKLKASPEKFKLKLEKPHYAAYRIIAGKTGRLLPFFRDLDSNLERSGLKIDFKAYVSLTIIVTILTSVVVSVLIPCMFAFVLNAPFFSIVLFGVGGSLFTVAFSIIGFYIYPIYRADKLKRELEDELPFTTGYMAILASAGVSPEKIFYSLSNLSVSLAVSKEAKNVVTDINLFGLDIISALEKTSKRTPSQRFHEMLEGFISTIHSGGDLAAYLRVKARQYMKLKRISLRKFSDTLSILSEFYVALLVTGPLLFVIMLAVMAMLGGGGLGMLGPDLLLRILTYLGIPLGSIVFLIVLDASSPRW